MPSPQRVLQSPRWDSPRPTWESSPANKSDDSDVRVGLKDHNDLNGDGAEKDWDMDIAVEGHQMLPEPPAREQPLPPAPLRASNESTNRAYANAAEPAKVVNENFASLSFSELLQAVAELHEREVAMAWNGGCPVMCNGMDGEALPTSTLPLQQVSQGTSPQIKLPTESRDSAVGALCQSPLSARGGGSQSDGLPHFVANPIWMESSAMDRRISTTSSAHPSFSVSWAVQKSVTGDLLVSSRGYFASLVLHPGSVKRLLWDVLSVLLLVYDLVSMPFIAAFAYQEAFGNPLSTMSTVTMAFWTADLFVSMLTGFQNGTQVIVAPKLVLMNFFKGWAFLDVGLVSMDWFFFLYEGSAAGASRLGRSIRTLRFMRTLRLVRLWKLRRILNDIQDHINTETLAISVGIIKIIMCLLLANHLVACAWYAVGDSVDNSRPSWISVHKMQETELRYRYATSLHWSLTQFTPASMEVFPENFYERTFSVVVLVFAMVCFSSFVSILTASMSEIRKIQNDGSRQFWLLRRYLRDWGVSATTRTRIQRYLEFAYRRQKQRVQEKDVQLLALLSEPLREEVKYETFAEHMSCHPLFLSFGDKKRCFSKAISCSPLARGDLLFTAGLLAKNLFFVSSGMLEYMRTTSFAPGDTFSRRGTGSSKLSRASNFDPDIVLEGGWAGEAALWTQWLHVGDMRSLEDSSVLIIDAEKFAVHIQCDRPLYLAVQKYAQLFVLELNSVDEKHVTDLLHLCFSPQRLVYEVGLSSHHFTYASEPEEILYSACRNIKRLGGLFSYFGRSFWRRGRPEYY